MISGYLLAGADGAGWASARERLHVPVAGYRFGADLAPAEAGTACGIGAEDTVLVLPDGFVAWRSPHASPEPVVESDRALRSVLAR